MSPADLELYAERVQRCLQKYLDLEVGPGYDAALAMPAVLAAYHRREINSAKASQRICRAALLAAFPDIKLPRD